ncbi:hypothetical protein FRC01_010901 [Tulasnella sp. 417]|nr:hypothetical protein FRC01_010901 [Tulasnella sp. 417]
MRGAGTVRWQSPELWEDVPKSFGSDVYAFAMTIVEIITGDVPFAHIKNNTSLILAITQKDERPRKNPLKSPSGTSYLNAWEVAEGCWKKDPQDRMTIRAAFQRLRDDPSYGAPFHRNGETYTSQRNLAHNIKPQPSERSISYKPPAQLTADEQNSLTTSCNDNPEIDSLVGPGYRVYDNQLPPELPGTLQVKTKKLAGGAFADVHQGLWSRPGKSSVTVAIKRVTLPGKNIPVEQFQTRINRETVIWKMANHPNILPFIGYQVDQTGTPMLVSPWCRHGNLATYVEANPDLSRTEKLKLLHGAACGLAYLHSLSTPIVHGDIKPQNFIILDNYEAALCDFGISKIVLAVGQRTGLTTSSNTLGTTRFQAPEIASGESGAVATSASDVYAFGAVVLATLSGEPPFGGKSDVMALIAVSSGQMPTREDHPLLPATDPLWNLLEACWSSQPEARPTMSVVVSKLKDEM